jgi:hypothetical protein
LRIEQWTTHAKAGFHRQFQRGLKRQKSCRSVGWIIQRLIPIGLTNWIADAHRDDGKRFVVRADEKLTAFLELESVIRPCGELV